MDFIRISISLKLLLKYAHSYMRTPALMYVGMWSQVGRATKTSRLSVFGDETTDELFNSNKGNE